MANVFDVRYFSESPGGFTEVATGEKYRCALGGFSSKLVIELNRCDLPVYHIGNNPDFHGHTWFLSREKPGLLVLHDRKLHEFISSILHRLGDDRDRYLRLMRQYYGASVSETAEAAWTGKIPLDLMSEHFPFTEFVVENALGLVVHTSHALRALAALVTLPLFRLPLPFASHHFAPPNTASGGGRKIRLVTFGYLSPNRRVVEFLRALAAMDERDLFELHIVGETGHVGQVEQMRAAVAELGLQAQVMIHGFVDEAKLDELLSRADLAVNLRFPSMGEASGSQLRIWDHALPSLVTKTEGYAEMPDDTVYFVRPEHEREDIQQHLSALAADPESFRRKGLNGKELLEREHSPASYVRALREIVEKTEVLRTGRVQRDLADTVGAKLGAFGNDGKVPAGREAFYANTIAALLE